MLAKKDINIIDLVNCDGCFDLQFRKDTRHERTNSPTYYRWKMQFIVTVPKQKVKVLNNLINIIGCGNVHIVGQQARFSVQNISEINDMVIPFFRKNQLADKKKKDFELWQKAAEIICRNKGKYLTTWKKNDLLSLIEIQKSSAKYKNRPKTPKWLQMAQTLAKTI
jgi:hypothetical protein